MIRIHEMSTCEGYRGESTCEGYRDASTGEGYRDVDDYL